jgi:hypothetical protein
MRTARRRSSTGATETRPPTSSASSSTTVQRYWDAQHRRPRDDRRPRQRRSRSVRVLAVGRRSRCGGNTARGRRHVQDPGSPQRRTHGALFPQRRGADDPRCGRVLRAGRQPGRRDGHGHRGAASGVARPILIAHAARAVISLGTPWRPMGSDYADRSRSTDRPITARPSDEMVRVAKAY